MQKKQDLRQRQKLKERQAAKREEARRQKIIANTISGTDITYNPTMSVSDDDIWLMACIIDWEAAYQPYAGKLAVANVILNRVQADIIRGQFRVLFIRDHSSLVYQMALVIHQTDLQQDLQMVRETQNACRQHLKHYQVLII